MTGRLKRTIGTRASLLRGTCSRLAALWLLFSLAAFSSCGSNTAPTQPSVLPGPVTNLTATLEDEVQELGGERIKWSTYWKLCWEAPPGAISYELQTLTSEGRSDKLRRQTESCFRLEVAAGDNERGQGFVNREVMLALQAGQLAYRVRAVFAQGRVGEWSAAIPVGAPLTNNDCR